MDDVKEVSTFERGFGILVIFSTLLILYLLVLDFMDVQGIEDVLFYSNLGVTFVFLIDLIFLYRRSSGPMDFAKKNWLDIIAVIPFSMAFRAAKLFRAWKIAKPIIKTTASSKVTTASNVSRVVSKIPRALRLKAEIPKMGKALSVTSKKRKKK